MRKTDCKRHFIHRAALNQDHKVLGASALILHSLTVLQWEQVAVEDCKFTHQHSLSVRVIQSEVYPFAGEQKDSLGRNKFHHWGAHWREDIKEGQCANVEPNAPPPDFAVGGLRVEIRLGVYEGIQKGENLGIKDTPFMYFALFWHTLQQAERTIDLSLLFH